MNFCIVSTPAHIDAFASSSESLIFNLLKLQNQSGYKINKLKRFNLFISCIETCRIIYNKKSLLYVFCTLIGLSNKIYIIHGTYIKIVTPIFTRKSYIF